MLLKGKSENAHSNVGLVWRQVGITMPESNQSAALVMGDYYPHGIRWSKEGTTITIVMMLYTDGMYQSQG